MGARAYRYLSLYQPAPGSVVEIGSERGEGSTTFLARYARRHKLRFYTADIDPEIHATACRITQGARLMPGRHLLQRLRTPLSIVYMDGFDWVPKVAEQEPWIADQRARYIQLGYDLNNENCQAEHLEEARLITGKAADRCVVIVDDTWHNNEDGWTGKGGLAVPHLQEHGFEVVDHDAGEPPSLGYVVMRR